MHMIDHVEASSDEDGVDTGVVSCSGTDVMGRREETREMENSELSIITNEAYSVVFGTEGVLMTPIYENIDIDEDTELYEVVP